MYTLPNYSVDNPGVAQGWSAVSGVEQALAIGYASYDQETPNHVSSAGMFARGAIVIPGVVNRGSPLAVSTSHSTPGVAQSSGTNVPEGASTLGLNLTLPTSPNGFFVPVRNPSSQYLIETNPLFTSGSAIGSDYLSQLLGYSAETMQKRLGDSNYEDKLIRDQIIAQTGRNILAGYTSEMSQVKGLMENAAEQAGGLGLTYGKPLTAEQRAALKEDLVWMEERQVGGRTVLVPVVYLAASTRSSVTGSATIAGRDVKVEGGGLTNEGGTIQAERSLTVNTTGDIVNRSGTISGGTVDLKTQGNVVNETVAIQRGDYGLGQHGYRQDRDDRCEGRPEASTRAKDVAIKGGDVKAGGSAAITAGGSVTIDSIQDKNASSSVTHDGRTTTVRNTQSTTQIGSNVQQRQQPQHHGRQGRERRREQRQRGRRCERDGGWQRQRAGPSERDGRSHDRNITRRTDDARRQHRLRARRPRRRRRRRPRVWGRASRPAATPT